MEERNEARSPGGPSRRTSGVVVDEVQSKPAIEISTLIQAAILPINTFPTHRCHDSYLELPPALDAAA
jgi:hypothetical protein